MYLEMCTSRCTSGCTTSRQYILRCKFTRSHCSHIVQYSNSGPHSSCKVRY